MLIDSFTFFNEYELVELRIRYLEEIIDVFVIVEANITHQGKKKIERVIEEYVGAKNASLNDGFLTTNILSYSELQIV